MVLCHGRVPHGSFWVALPDAIYERRAEFLQNFMMHAHEYSSPRRSAAMLSLETLKHSRKREKCLRNPKTTVLRTVASRIGINWDKAVAALRAPA